MRVNIDEIKEAGLARSWDVTQAQLDEMLAGGRSGFRARGPAHVDARLEKLGRRVRVEADARAELAGACKRCLAPVSVDLPVGFELTLGLSRAPAAARTPRPGLGPASNPRRPAPCRAATA